MATMTEKKMTRVEALELAIEAMTASGETEAVEVLEAIKASVGRKGESKADKARKEQDERIRTAILAEMVSGTKYTITEMIQSLPCVSGLSASKVTALMKPMIASGVVAKTTEKGRSMYALVC